MENEVLHKIGKVATRFRVHELVGEPFDSQGLVACGTSSKSVSVRSSDLDDSINGRQV